MLDNDYVIYFMIIVFITYIVYYTFKKRVLKPDYYSINYWERRYEAYNKSFDWYASSEKVFDDFKITSFMQEKLNKKSKILELGCGTSPLSAFIAKQGYTSIKAVDYSKEAIKLMNKMFFHNNIIYMQGDFNSLTSLFKEAEFDFIIEKAGLDTIGTLKDKEIIKLRMKSVFAQIYKILKPGGYMITISNNNPEFWKEVIHDYLEESGLFIVEEYKKDIFNKPNNSFKMNYYYYLLRKLSKTKIN